MLNVAFVDLNRGIRIGEVNIGLLELISYVKSRVKISFTYFNESPQLKTKWKDYDVLAFSSRGYEMQTQDLEWLKNIPRLKIFGGPGPTILPEYSLKFSDLVVIGEGEVPLQNIFELLLKKGLTKEDTLKILAMPELRKIFNIATKDFKTPRKFYEFEISKIDWTIVPNLNTYIKNWHYLDYIDGVRGISLVSSRSCPFQCSFCQPTVSAIFGKKMKYKKIEYIKEELIFLHDRFGVNAFMFHDDTFTVNRKRSVELANMLLDLRKKGMKFNWIFNTRAGLIDDSLANLFHKAGAVQCHIGIETLNEKLRNGLLNKGVSDSQIKETIKILKHNHILVLGFFMLGFPDYSILKTFRDVLNIANTDVDLATFSVLTVLPGTFLAQKKFVSSFGNYYVDNENTMSEIDPFVLEVLRYLAYFFFYIHPKRIARTVKQMLNMRTFLYKIERLFGGL